MLPLSGLAQERLERLENLERLAYEKLGRLEKLAQERSAQEGQGQKARDFFTDFYTQVNKLNDLCKGDGAGMGFGYLINFAYINDLNKEDEVIGRTFSEDEVTKRKVTAQRCTRLIHDLVLLTKEVHQPLWDTKDKLTFPAHANVHATALMDLQARAKQCASSAIGLTSYIMQGSTCSDKQVHLMNELVLKLGSVYRNPCEFDYLTRLDALVGELNKEFETSFFAYMAHTFWRNLTGLIEVLLGFAIFAAGLYYTVGNALIIGTALVTAAIDKEHMHFGPLTWGFGIASFGLANLTGGPTVNQRREVPLLTGYLGLMSNKAKTIAKAHAESKVNDDDMSTSLIMPNN